MNETMEEAPQKRSTQELMRQLCWVALAIILGLRAIVSESLWWTLSKGEAVVKGTFHPSSNLLYESNSYDADWLSGLPAFLFHLILDIPGLAILRILYVVGLILLVRRLSSENPSINLWMTWAIAAISGIAMLTAFDPTPIANELFLAAGLFYFAFRSRTISITSGWWEVLALSIAWANLGPHSIYAIPIVLAATVREFELGNRKLTSLLPIVAAIVGLMVTPRCWYVFYDSLIQTYPQLYYENALLTFDHWKPLIEREWTMELIAFLVLSLFVLVQLLLSRSSISLAVLWVLIQWMAWTCSGNVPIVSAIQLVMIFEIWKSEQASNKNASTFNSLALLNSKAAGLVGVAISAILLLAIIPGYKTYKDSRLGFGIAPHLSPNELQIEIQELSLGGSAHCGDIRSAGMLAWIRPGTIQPTTTPTRALIDGQLRDYISLNQEFELGWRLYHPRNDGTAGGWYLRIKDRPIQVVLFSYENTAVARKMLPTVWKPMSIISAAIPYGHSNRKVCDACSKPIINTIKSQVQLLSSPYELDSRNAIISFQYIDLWGLISGQTNLQDDLAQCRFLIAMEKYSSCARLIQPALTKYQTKEVLSVLLEGEEEQAIHEKAHSGEASLFRTLLVEELKKRLRKADSESVFEDLGWDDRSDDEIMTPIRNSVESLIKGDYNDALNALPTASDNPEIQFARAVLSIYSGQYTKGMSIFTVEEKRKKHSKISILSEDFKSRALEDFRFLQSMNLLN